MRALYDAEFKWKAATAETSVGQSWTLKAIIDKFALILSRSLSTKLDRRTAYKSVGRCLHSQFQTGGHRIAKSNLRHSQSRHRPQDALDCAFVSNSCVRAKKIKPRCAS